jgi:hypothetical protein
MNCVSSAARATSEMDSVASGVAASSSVVNVISPPLLSPPVLIFVNDAAAQRT